MEEKQNIETALRAGKQILVDMTAKDPELFAGIAEKFNLHMGEPYRMIIAGSNPMDKATFDGVMTELSVLVDPTGFRLKKLVLEQGLTWDDHSAKRPFEREDFTGPDDPKQGYHLIGFGRIVNADGFYRARERIVKEQGGK